MNLSICWLEIIKAFSPIVGALVALIGAWLAYRYAVRKLSDENAASIERKKYEAILHANERCWSLLMYTSETENACSIFTWVRAETTKEDSFYFHPDRCEAFFDALRVIYYEEGNGIYFDRKVTESLFEIRGILYGLHLKVLKEKREPVFIENPELAKRVFFLTNQCRGEIREAIELDGRKLNLKNKK